MAIQSKYLLTIETEGSSSGERQVLNPTCEAGGWFQVQPTWDQSHDFGIPPAELVDGSDPAYLPLS